MKNLQSKVKRFCQKHNLKSPPTYQLLDTYSELGEVAKEVLKITSYGKKELETHKEIKEEIGDVLYSLITLANSLDIDLERQLNKTLKKYQKRIKKGGPGSEND